MTGSNKHPYHVLDMGFRPTYVEILEGLKVQPFVQSSLLAPVSVVLLKCTGHYFCACAFPRFPLDTRSVQSFMPVFV